jgi:FKBP-type peptidyl-prolyl cis-trans isomerase FklB
MRNANYRTLILVLAGTVLSGITAAQQSPAPASNPPAGSAAATPKKQSSTASQTTGTTAKKTPAPVVLNTQKDNASYAIGMNVGKGLKDNLKKDSVDIDPELLARGVKDALAGNKLLLTDEESQTVLTTLQNDVMAHRKEAHDVAVAKNAKEGEDFLTANKAKPGVVTLPSGLQYKIITPGDGPKPSLNDVVLCNYKGTLVDGTEFDNSYKRGKPASIPVSRVIKGWTEALQLMPVGSTWQLFIPPSLGYGDAGTNGGPIGPNETLIFEVQLLQIQPKPAAPGAPGTQPQAQPDAGSQAKPSTPAPAPEPKAQPQTQPAQPQQQPQK